MHYYYVNRTKDENGKNEVHTSDCYWLAQATSKEALGYFENGIKAVVAAKRNGYPNADGCKYCSPEAHTE